MRILCVFAHPDDECFCAGTLARLAKQVTPDHDGHYTNDNQIRVIYMNCGVGIRRQDPNTHSIRQVKDGNAREITRLKELDQSMDLIGISDFQVYDTPNMRMDMIPQLEVNQIVEDEIAVFKPDLVITHYGNDLNEDHRRTFTAVQIATRLRPGQIVKAVISIDQDQSRDVFKPNMFVDISTTIDVKMKSMELYRSEWQKPPGQRNEESMEIIARYNGYRTGLTTAENFQILYLVNPFNLD